MRRLSKVALFTLLLCWALAKSFAQGTYSKIEASFHITNLTTDPFDFTATDVRAKILQPDNSTLLLPAFFDGGTTWRVRHAPAMPGTYTISGITLNGSPLAVSNLQPGSWIVAGPPTDPGFIRVDSSNPCLLYTSPSPRDCS